MRIALLSAALGGWLIALPLTLGFQGHPVGISDLATGLLLIAFGVFFPRFCVFVTGIAGVWLQMAPLVFWAPSAVMYFNDTLVGALAILLCFQRLKKEPAEGSRDRPSGWTYNPSALSHRIPTVTLAMLCWFFSRYMAMYQLGYIDQIWDPFFKDGTLNVITSTVSKKFPVSDAGMGAVCYTLEFLLGWQGGGRRWAKVPWLVLAFAFLVIPVGMVSITLIILQPVIVGVWCTWCLATAVLMLAMIVLTGGELAATVQHLNEVRKRGDSMWKALWKGARSVEMAKSSRAGKTCSGEITFPLSLIFSIMLGIWLIVSTSLLNTYGSLARCHYILGPVIVSFSVIAFSEVFRCLRRLNFLFGLVLVAYPWLDGTIDLVNMANSMTVGIALMILTPSKIHRTGS